MDIVRHVEGLYPHFVRVDTDVRRWIEANGLPSDLIPYSVHPVGRVVGQQRTALVPRYDCCHANLMMPLYERIKADGNTLLIRGTKTVDTPRQPFRSGDTPDGIELWYPIEDWSHADVFEYLRAAGAPLCRVYEHVTNAPECARCPAWWGEQRAAYLRQFHPALFDEYRARLALVVGELNTPLTSLTREVAQMGGVRALLEGYPHG
jgi:3'-phosphoadenosine 5'-phosphosulfate sulfotransferase (PAPS reductase)/FAD synthetase